MRNKLFQAIVLIVFSATVAASQTGGTFTIEKSVIAAGGGTAAGGAFQVEGTTAQAAADIVQNAPFIVYGGFITPSAALTAASASVSGKVLTANGKGLVNATVLLTDMRGNGRTVRTSSFGYFRFDEVETGQTYICSVQSKRYNFAPQVVTVLDNLTELNFVGW